jgi:hypothetical protein
MHPKRQQRMQNSGQKRLVDKRGDDAVRCPKDDGRTTYVYALTNEWGRTWAGSPLPRVLDRIRSDSRGAVRMNICRAYKHARAQKAARYNGFRVVRRRKDAVDFERLRKAADTVVCLPPVEAKRCRKCDGVGDGGVEEGPVFSWDSVCASKDGKVAMAA